MRDPVPNHVNSSEKQFYVEILKDVNKSSVKIRKTYKFLRRQNCHQWNKNDEFPQLFRKITKGICGKNVWRNIILKESAGRNKDPLIMGLQKVMSKEQIAGGSPSYLARVPETTLICVLLYWLIGNLFWTTTDGQ